MGRAHEGDEEMYWMWAGRVKRVMNGKPGQRVLREMEAALLALPEKRLITSVLCNEAGEVCALGALAVHREVKKGKAHTEAVKELHAKMIDLEDTQYTADQLGLTFTLTWEAQYANDEEWEYANGVRGETPEVRYERMLKWVRERIKPLSVKG